MDKQRPEITFLIKALNKGGAEKVCVTLCNAFVNEGYSVKLLIVNNPPDSLMEHLSAKVEVVNFNQTNVRNCIFSLARYLTNKRPSKILIFNIELALLSLIIKYIFNLNIVVISRSINTLSKAYEKLGNPIEKYITLPLMKILYKQMDIIIAQSTGMKEDLILNYGIPEYKIKLIFNPAYLFGDIDFEKMNGGQTNKNFVFAGRLEPQKGLFNLLDIFEEVFKLDAEITLTIIGEGTFKEKLLDLINKKHLTKNVEILGYKSEIVPYVLNAKAVVLTSYFEGFPNILVESIYVGTPVISYDCKSGPSDIIKNKENGLLIPFLDKTNFVNSVFSVANNIIEFDKTKIIESAKPFKLDSIFKEYENLMVN